MLHVIKFGAPWCGPCKQIDPQLSKLEADGKITLVNVDVEEQPHSAKHFLVRSIPTLIVQDGMNHAELGRGSDVAFLHKLLGDWDAS